MPGGEGQTSVFACYIPNEHRENGVMSEQPETATRGNILIVDDTPTNLHLFMRLLTKQGYDVRPVGDGYLALESARAEPPDLILLDVLMPGMTGYEVCERLKADERTRDIPVIFVSALGEVLDKVKAFAVGGVDYISRPFQIPEVLARITTHLTLRNLQQGLQEKNAQLRQEIAERKRAEERLLQQQYALATAEERARIGRELHDNLGQVIGYIHVQAQAVSTLLDQGQTTQARAALQQLVEVVQDANTDVRDYILGIKDAAETAPDFFAALRKYLHEFEETYGITTQLSLPDDLPRRPLTRAAEMQLLRIIQETLTNVRKHAGVNRARVYFFFDTNQIRVIIEDDGRGFDVSQQRTKSSEPQSLNRQGEDAHFGLEIMRDRAVEIGGSLEVRSTPGRGTRVIVHIPRVVTAVSGKLGLRVMLVDDHPMFLEGIRTLLTARGLQVVGTAHDGIEAQEMARELLPDVILMDVQMPRCDGVEATRRIKAEFPDIKIVMLSVVADDETLFAALKAGASGYLLKSLEGDDFYHSLRNLARGEVVLAPELAARVLAEFAQQDDAFSAPREPDAAPPAILDPQNFPELTSRQVEVLDLVAQGLTYKEVGARIHLTERTVRYHMGQIVEKLQLEDRRAVIAYALRQGKDDE